jgi:hypothetical protein
MKLFVHMYKWLYIYVCIFIFIYIHIYVYIFICIYICTFFFNDCHLHLFRCPKCNQDVCLTHRNQEVSIFMYMCIHTLLCTYTFECTYIIYEKKFIYEYDNCMFLTSTKIPCIFYGRKNPFLTENHENNGIIVKHRCLIVISLFSWFSVREPTYFHN